MKRSWIRRLGAEHPVESYCQFVCRGHLGYGTMFLMAAVRILFTKLRIKPLRWFPIIPPLTLQIRLHELAVPAVSALEVYVHTVTINLGHGRSIGEDKINIIHITASRGEEC